VFVANATEFSSPPLSPSLVALRGQLHEGGAGAPLEVFGPVSAMQELALVCETMLAGRGGPIEDDRKTLVADVKAMRAALGPKTAEAVGATLNDFIVDLRAPRLGFGKLSLTRASAASALRASSTAHISWLTLHERRIIAAPSGERWTDRRDASAVERREGALKTIPLDHDLEVGHGASTPTR
jgi:hypothetical protein